MKEILKPIFEWIIGNFSLFNNPLYDYVAMYFVGIASFAFAWIIVGLLYDEDIIGGRIIGSLFHWIFRLLAFLVIFFIVNVVIWLIRFIISVPTWIWWVALVFGIAVILIRIIMETRNSRSLF